MKLSVGWILLLAFIISSCQRETDDDSPFEIRLVKSVEKSGSDSVTIEYFYDVNRKLIRIKQSGIFGGSDRYAETWITRNPNGSISKTVEKAAYLQAAGTDSVVTTFNYTSATGRYIYSVMRNYGTVSVYDSVVYDYNSTGPNLMIRDNHWQSVMSGPFQRFKQEYVYALSGRIDSVKNYDYVPGPGTYTLSFYTAYQYDTKDNPLNLDREAVILYQFPFSGLNNMTNRNTVFITRPSANSSAAIVYTYHPDHFYPLTASTTKTPGSPSTTVFYYQ